MFLCRCVLPVLAFHLLLEEMSAFVLPDRPREKRDVSWLDQEFFPHLPDHSDPGDLSLGDAGEIRPGLEGSQHSPSVPFLTLPEHLSVSRHHLRRDNEKRRKLAPLDRISTSLMSSYRTRKDEPDDNWEDDSK